MTKKSPLVFVGAGRSEDPLREVEELEPGGDLVAAVRVPIREVVERDEVVLTLVGKDCRREGDRRVVSVVRDVNGAFGDL